MESGSIILPLEHDYSKRQRRIAVLVNYFCLGLCFATWASRIPDIKTTLGLSDSELGSILFALPIGQFVTMPISGRLVAKYGSKKILRFALALYAIELTNLALAQHGWQLALGLFLFGVIGNMSNISVNTQGVAVEKLYAPKPIMASFHGAWSLAGCTGAVIGLTMIAFHTKPHIHFCIVAVLVIIAELLSNKYLVSGSIAGDTETTEKKKLFSRPEGILIQLGIIAFCSMASEGAMFDWSGVYFKDVVKAEGPMVALGYVIFMATMATGRFIGDKMISIIGRKRLLQISGVLTSCGLFTAVLFPYVVPATIGFLLVGFGVSSVIPITYSLGGRLSKVSPSMALATISSVGYLGFLMGPPMIGYIAHVAGLRYSYALIGIFGFCIAFIVTKLKVVEK